MKPLLVSSGEPAGIGPDICLELAATQWPVVVLGDKQVLQVRSKQLNRDISFVDYAPGQPLIHNGKTLTVLNVPCEVAVKAGVLDPRNSQAVMTMLDLAVTRCLKGEFTALVTAPVHKAVINQANIPFTGHTEFLAERCHAEQVIMMLASKKMKVALLTTHLPLRQVPDAITIPSVISTVSELHRSFQTYFNIARPRIAVAGLNPHAGEGGYLGREEIDVLIPAIHILQQQNINVAGPYPADTLFTPHQLAQYDVALAMYHDQGLPVIKYADFSLAVNVTLGLPMIRTSVDHGTALELAGTGKADSSSLFSAVDMALAMVVALGKKHDH